MLRITKLMIVTNFLRKNLFLLICGVLIASLLTSCGIYKPVDARKTPANVNERVQKNLEEGKGVTLKSLTRGGGETNYQFASSNPMWRATLEILDFLPLANVDYSGGIITTDWYNEGTSSDESIKITVRFLTNEIRSDSLDIKIFYKTCTTVTNCLIDEKESSLKNELRKQILKQAAIYKSQSDKKIKKYDTPPDRTRE